MIIFYPSKNSTWLFESDMEVDADQQTALLAFENTVCRMIYTVQNEKDPAKEKDQSQIDQYCMPATTDVIYQSESLLFLFSDGQPEEEKKQSASHKMQAKELENQFNKLDVVQSDDLVAYDQIQMLVEERLYQVSGNLYKYFVESDTNVLTEANVFLCVDRMAGAKRHRFMLHVTDAKQERSLTRIEVSNDGFSYTFSEVEKLLFWIGESKPGQESLPAWTFQIEHQADVPRVKGVLTKVIFETNHQEDIERAAEMEEQSYLESQVVGEIDVDMEDLSQIDDYEYADYARILDDRSEVSQEEEKQSSNPLSLGFTDDDAETGFDPDQENSEAIQAQTYDRTFIVNGPVVKVYKPETDNLQFNMNFPILKNEESDVIHPCNIMLHSTDNNLIFSDKNDMSQLYNFDLQVGKIVE